MTRAFFRTIISRHGCPTKLLTDLGTQFTSNLFKSVCEMLGIELLHSSAYHHQCNGKVERFNRFLVNTLGTVVNASMKNWDLLLDNVLFVYRINYNRTLDDSPFYLLYGRDIVMPQDLSNGVQINQTTYKDLDEFKLQRLKNLMQAYENFLQIFYSNQPFREKT